MLKRLDGLPKVTGARVYGSDFRPSDPELGWPDQCEYAVIFRYQRPGYTFAEVALEMIPAEFRPHRLVTAEMLVAVKVTNENEKESRANPVLLPAQKSADHIGQAVAIGYLDSWRKWRRFREWLVTHPDVLRYEANAAIKRIEEQDVRTLLSPLLEAGSRLPGVSYNETQYVRLAGEGDEDKFSFFTCEDQKDHNQKAWEQIQEIEKSVRAQKAHWLERSFSTATNDPMFMELESGLAWLDRRDAAKPMLRVVVGTQSPEKDRSGLIDLFREAQLKPTIDLHACPPGGGFGGRDLSAFPLYLALAAYFADGPVRLAFDRYEQFQVGIKRHASAVTARLYYQPDQRLVAYVMRGVFDGGGTKNLTGAVVGLAALQAAGPYAIPMTAIHCQGYHTHGATAGSMRGFGIPQVTFAIESMVDEVAELLVKDPIELRLGQLLEAGQRDVTGYRLQHPIGTKKLCELALQEPLWRERQQEKTRRDTLNIAYGVGFACCMQSFGTSRDAVFTALELTDSGLRVISAAVDMGQGPETSLALATQPVLGRTATEVRMGEDAFFDVLALTTEGNPTAWNYTPKIGSAMSASMTAFFHLHAVRQAAQLLYELSLRPAAFSLWGVQPANLVWQDGELCAEGLPALTWSDLVSHCRVNLRPVGAMVHTYFQDEFATAKFNVADQSIEFPIDALALRYGDQPYQVLQRTAQHYPVESQRKSKRTLYAATGHLVAVEVNRRNGQVQIVDAVSLLDPGVVHHEALLRGQVEGGFAMGVGMTLLEELPAPLSGVAPGWNLHRYQVPRAKHLPLGHLHQLRLVPFEPSANSPVVNKGIAEATMTTVPPAVANAIAHAIGRRVNRLPIRPQDIRAVLNQD